MSDMVDDGKPEAGEELGAFARLLHRERRTRDAYMSEGLFGEPAWDILLDLFIASEEGREVSALAAAATLAVPEPTVLRCLAHLVATKLVVGAPSGGASRASLMLSPAATARMCDYFRRTAAA